MRHSRKGRKFGRVRKVRRNFVRNLAAHFILRGKIKTTLARAKELRSIVEKNVTLAKSDTLSNRRLLLRRLPLSAVGRLFKEWGPKFRDRKGGYTRIIRLVPRRSDGSKMAVIEF